MALTKTRLRELYQRHSSVLHIVAYAYVGLFLLHVFAYVLWPAWLLPPVVGGGVPVVLPLNEGGAQCFDNGSIWHELRTAAPEAQHDLGRGGTPKLVLDLAHGRRALFKPHLRGGHTSSGNLESPLLELIAFHIDCMLGLRRAIPVASKAVPRAAISAALQPWQLRLLHDKGWDATMEYSQGTAQHFVEGLGHISWLDRLSAPLWRATCRWLLFLRYDPTCGDSDRAVREHSSRDVFDFLIGNSDRDANQFYLPPAGQMVYADHNHQQAHRVATFALRPDRCLFFPELVASLRRYRDLTADGQQPFSALLRDSLRRYEPLWQQFGDDEPELLAKLDVRFAAVVKHAEDCGALEPR